MKLVKQVLKVFLITTGVVIVLAIIVAPKDNKKDEVPTAAATTENTEQVKDEPEPIAEVVSEPEVKAETVEEQMARWDRGEFTEEEIAEIKAEEKREDKASVEFMKNQ